MSAVSGKYRLDRRLGGGGMAEVFAGSTRGAEGFSRTVAIKRVLPGFSDNAGFSRMFVAEAQISSRLVHPNIVSVLDFDRDDDGRLFLVMELVEGADLDALLATGLLAFPVVIAIVAEVLRGLGFAHDLPTASDIRGVVHRDVSPHNVLLSWEGAVKVSDFGIAKARAASEATASVFLKGKPAYMSPEQANGQPLDGRSDLFAVGVMLWEMLVGQRLFVGQDTRATLAAVLFGQIPRPRTLRSEVPRDLERVTMKLLERELAARYASAELAIADLMQCADAPRAGREAVIAILAERFPDRAPVRHSVARARSRAAAPAPPPGSAPLYSRPTLTGAPDQPIALPAPSGYAATGRLAARARRWPGLLVLAAVLFVASSVAAFVTVSLVRRPATTARTSGGAAPSELAAPREPPKHAVQSPQPAATDGPNGSLRVVGAPILTVTVDGTPHGTTPLTIPLTAGPHRVRLQNLEHHIDDTV
ncbi:MAG TPA: serine/threonine-protein kinase, partial [Kofleriaceae bacterium]|nr:serine/threonine-protein kinase [Kofleriaceae bacterium]